MCITSPNFLVLLVAVLGIYYLLTQRAQIYWLLIVSYAFYVTWAWQFSIILLVITIVNYSIGKKLQKEGNKNRLLFLAGISFNLATLIFFRMADNFKPGLLNLFTNLGIQIPEETLRIILPVGMAFYTLQNISYLVDVYRKHLKASNDFIVFALYLAYFPKLLSGPIERARTFLPKLTQLRRVNNEQLARSFTLIIIGLIRKVFISGILDAVLFWDAFETPSKYTSPELIGWLLAYSIFIYNDFAGYTSIVRGISGLFGIELSQNFAQPFLARNLTEFWNSWHITLSSWLRDYIYFPTSRFILSHERNRNNILNLFLPPMATMLISGIWHGLNWHMLSWGAMHGSYLILERVSSLKSPIVQAEKWSYWRQGISRVIIFMLVTITWVPFLMELPIAVSYWNSMLDWSFPVIRFRRIFILLPLFLLSCSIDWLQRLYQDETFVLRWPRLVQAVLLAGSLLLLMVLMQSENVAPFVYQGF